MGVLAPMSSLISSIGICSNLFSLIAMVDCLIATMVERHFQITKIHYSRSKFHRKLIYFIQISTLLLMTLSFVYFIAVNVDDNKAYKLLTENVQNSDILLSYQPSLFTYAFGADFITFAFIFVALIIGVSRLYMITWLLYENFNYSKKFKISLQTQRHFNLMLQTTIVQIFILMTFGLPCVAWVLLLAIPAENLGKISIILSGFKLLYPVADVIIVIFTVKPYREEVKKIFSFPKKC